VDWSQQNHFGTQEAKADFTFGAAHPNDGVAVLNKEYEPTTFQLSLLSIHIILAGQKWMHDKIGAPRYIICDGSRSTVQVLPGSRLLVVHAVSSDGIYRLERALLESILESLIVPYRVQAPY